MALYLDFEGEKNIHVLKVLIWGFGVHWRFLTGVQHLNPDLDMVTCFRFPYVDIFIGADCQIGIENFEFLGRDWDWD